MDLIQIGDTGYIRVVGNIANLNEIQDLAVLSSGYWLGLWAMGHSRDDY